MATLWTLIIGLIVGAIAKLLMPGKDPGGFIITILLGIAGAFLAGFIASIIGAIILLIIYRMIKGRIA